MTNPMDYWIAFLAVLPLVLVIICVALYFNGKSW